MSSSYWLVSSIPILISFLLLATLSAPHLLNVRQKGAAGQLTPRESAIGRIAIALFVVGMALLGIGTILELFID